jgi:hypothetical protein
MRLYTLNSSQSPNVLCAFQHLENARNHISSKKGIKKLNDIDIENNQREAYILPSSESDGFFQDIFFFIGWMDTMD